MPVTQAQVLEAQAKVKKFRLAVENTMAYLYVRWADEKDHENIADYLKPLQKKAEEHGVELVRFNKRPFGPVVKVDGLKFAVEMKSNWYGSRLIS